MMTLNPRPGRETRSDRHSFRRRNGTRHMGSVAPPAVKNP